MPRIQLLRLLILTSPSTIVQLLVHIYATAAEVIELIGTMILLLLAEPQPQAHAVLPEPPNQNPNPLPGSLYGPVTVDEAED